jgi:superfamily I DNA and/or RNA helicase
MITLIQGPPGTGKTTTAVEIVLEWLRSSPSQIMACADSNIAVDILYNEFQKAGIKSIRIGPGYDEKSDFKMDKNYKIYSVYQSSKQYHNANNVRFGIMKRMLGEAQVVCATCVGSTSEFLRGMVFQRVIIDEATQATEMATLIPLTRGAQQVVLIGDHKQLPPTVISTFA